MKEDECDQEGSLMSVPPEVSGPVTVVTDTVQFDTQGDADMVNLTEDVRRRVSATGLRAGIVTVFVPGATGAVTTLEFEPGVVQDFRDLFNHIALPTNHYYHNDTHPDANGHAHVRAGLLGPSLVIPFDDGKLCLGRWQEICFVCFDNRPRERTVFVQTMGV
jgi:secondary thiamine-phosphate synthase enzyme